MNNFKCCRWISRLRIAFILAIIYILAGCNIGGVKEDVVDYQSEKIIAAVQRGEYSSAYGTTVSLYLKGFPRAQDKARELVRQYPQIARGAEQYLASQFKGNASLYGSIEEFRSAKQPEIDVYKNLVPASDASFVDKALTDAFNESRKLYPIRYPENHIRAGQTYEQFVGYVTKPPIAKTELIAPDDPKLRAVVYEYKFIPPKSAGISESLSHWFAFVNQELMFTGVGGLKEAEYQLFQHWVADRLANKKMNLSTAYKSIYGKYQELYGQPDALTAEYVTYVIMLADKLDKKQISETESEYLLAQKRSEMAEKYQALQAQQAEQQRQQEMLNLQRQQMRSQQEAQERTHALARSQLLLQGGLGLMQLQQNERMINSINQPKTYTITPLGQGWIMQGR